MITCERGTKALPNAYAVSSTGTKETHIALQLSRLRPGFQVIAVCVLCLAVVGCALTGEVLPKLGIDIDKTSASGLSAGAYMAGQLQVVHSSKVVGVGTRSRWPLRLCGDGNSGPYALGDRKRYACSRELHVGQGRRPRCSWACGKS